MKWSQRFTELLGRWPLVVNKKLWAAPMWQLTVRPRGLYWESKLTQQHKLRLWTWSWSETCNHRNENMTRENEHEPMGLSQFLLSTAPTWGRTELGLLWGLGQETARPSSSPWGLSGVTWSLMAPSPLRGSTAPPHMWISHPQEPNERNWTFSF